MAYSETLFSINSKARLPLFQAFNHPLALPTAKRTFVMFLDTSPAGMKECLGIERNLEIPFAHFNDLQAIGMYCNTFQHQYIFFLILSRDNDVRPKRCILSGLYAYQRSQIENSIRSPKNVDNRKV